MLQTFPIDVVDVAGSVVVVVVVASED